MRRSSGQRVERVGHGQPGARGSHMRTLHSRVGAILTAMLVLFGVLCVDTYDHARGMVS